MIPHMEFSNSFSATIKGRPYNVSREHPEYDTLWQAVVEGDEQKFLSHYDIESRIKTAFDSDEVREKGMDIVVKDGQVLYQGKPLHNSVCDRIIRAVERSESSRIVQPLMRFLDNLMGNPSHQSVKELYGFLEHGNMPITEDGCFLAYKAVRKDYRDKHSGKFDNSVGAVNEMPRNMVNDDRTKTCSTGFHVGAWGYAGKSGWFTRSGDRVMVVKVNPRDAVSVPHDHSDQKLRVCRYEVVDEVDPPEEREPNQAPSYEAPLVHDFIDEDDGYFEVDTDELWEMLSDENDLERGDRVSHAGSRAGTITSVRHHEDVGLEVQVSFDHEGGSEWYWPDNLLLVEENQVIEDEEAEETEGESQPKSVTPLFSRGDKVTVLTDGKKGVIKGVYNNGSHVYYKVASGWFGASIDYYDEKNLEPRS